MKKSNTIMDITQVYVSQEDIKSIAEKLDYIDTARKFTIYELLRYFIVSAVDEWKSFRDGVEKAINFGLENIDYSTFSKKASHVKYEIFKEIYELIRSRINRKTCRVLKLKKDLLAVDSTTITVGKGRLKWAKFKGNKAGIKLHVGYNVTSDMPEQVVETTANKHDGPVGEAFQNSNLILVEDRAYAKIERFDNFIDSKQDFVVRIKNNFTMVQSRKLKSLQLEDSIIEEDVTCYLGKDQKQSKNRIRVVIFNDENGHEMRIATNLINYPPELIADIYRERWNIEQFFRFIKQNLNIKRLFGTNKNAVYSQMYCALIAYIFIHFMHQKVIEKYPQFKISRIQFLRRLHNDNLRVEIRLVIYNLLNKSKFNTVKN